MIPLSSAVSGGLNWSQPGSRSYELRLNGEVAGTLQRPSVWSSDYVAESNDGRWIFRVGSFASGAEIVDAASNQLMATLKSSWGDARTLTFADGQVFQFERRGWWYPAWTVMTENRLPVLQLNTREQTVELWAGEAVPEGRLSLLILFAWYRVLRAEEEAQSVALVAAIS